LILIHVTLRNVSAGDVRDEWNGVRGIADVRVFAGGAGGRAPGEAAIGLQVERLRDGLGRRPGVVLLPDVCTGLEGVGPGQCGPGLVLQPVREEGSFDVVAEEGGGAVAELDVAEGCAGAA